MSTQNPDDIFDEIETSGLRIVAKHAWPFAEYYFKLTSWLFIAAGVLALGKKTGSLEIFIAGGVLTTVWFAVAMATIFKGIGYVQDAVRDRWVVGRDPHSLKTLAIDFVITGLTVIPLIQFFVATLGIAGDIIKQLIATGSP